MMKVSPKVRFCSCKDPRHLATWTRLQVSRKRFKVHKNNFKFGKPVDSHPYPTLFLKGYDREILTRERKAPMDRLPVQPIKSKKKKSETDSKQYEKTLRKIAPLCARNY